MTTQAIAIEGGVGRSESRLEELVDRVIEALFGVQQEESAVPAPTVAKSIHDARSMRNAGDLDGALAVMSEVDTPNGPVRDAAGRTPSGWTWCGPGSVRRELWSTAPVQAGPRPWSPGITARWR